MVDDRPQIPSGVKATIEAEEKAVDALATHIKTQGRAFSLFDAARLVLAGEDRHRVRFECEAERLVGLFHVPSAHALYETREEALKHLLRSPEIMASYYQEEAVELEAPKGNFTSVAVCGFSGEILGPPSHHSYQAASKRLYSERYSNMSFEDYRRRIRVENSPEMVEKWKEQQSKGRRWIYLKGEGSAPPPVAVPPPTTEAAPSEGAAEGTEEASPAPEAAEAPADTRETFNTRAEVEAHFRNTHGDKLVVEVREAVLPGTIRREQLSPGLGRLFRRNLEEARKHLFELSQKIAHSLERRGMKLFKRRAGKMFVSRVKPRAIDPGVIFSERIKHIVEAIRAEPGILPSKLLEKISPSTAVATEGTEADATAEAKTKAFTDDQVAALRDLRWLSDEGYVIEYSDGPIFLGVQGEPPQHSGDAKAKGKDKGGENVEAKASAENVEVSHPETAATSERESHGAPVSEETVTVLTPEVEVEPATAPAVEPPVAATSEEEAPTEAATPEVATPSADAEAKPEEI